LSNLPLMRLVLNCIPKIYVSTDGMLRINHGTTDSLYARNWG